MITRIKKHGKQYEFVAGKCKYKCEDWKSLAAVRLELLRQQISVKVK